VPGFVPPPPPEPPPLQLIPATATTTSNTASGTHPHRRCLGTASRKKKQASAIAPPAKGHPRPEGRLDGRNITPDGAIVKQVIVALPVVDAALSVIVFGEVKFRSGVPNVHVGGSTAPAGVLVTV
jgi:hypothetical protein